MTAKTFKKKLSKLIEDSNEFITWDNTDKDFKGLLDNNLVICGEDDRETFSLLIIKV